MRVVIILVSMGVSKKILNIRNIPFYRTGKIALLALFLGEQSREEKLEGNKKKLLILLLN